MPQSHLYQIYSASGLGVGAYIYWSGTEAGPGVGIDRAYDIYFETSSGYGGVAYAHEKVDLQYSLAVHDGNVAAAIPEPEAYAMMLAGLSLLGLTRCKKQKAA